ncbi:hypothetical protein PVK06_010080 [Gossypium arboreum]|uniref:Uncharacterized protein n=1 Tax=Gossypium arboreum TaxID=29729 RepID=A0ABR0QPB7_GOSAR|nr:hypothetical protein PVK06_010080 [Gossypium arboreum]
MVCYVVTLSPNVLTTSLQGYNSKLMVHVKEPRATVEDFVTLTRMCHDTKNPQAKIVPTIEDVTTLKLGCHDVEV